MKASRAIFFICLCLSLISCNFFGGKENAGGEEPGYTAQIAWDSGLITNDSQSHTVDGNYIYFYERPPGYTQVNIYSLTKLNAETGEFIWRSITFSEIVFCQPIVIGGYVYVFLEPNIIACFDRETGGHTATAAVDIDNKNLEFEWNVTAYGRYLYMGLCRNGRYFARLDVNGITHGDPGALQELTPEVLWEPETGEPVSAKQVFYKNAVYTSTYSPLARSPVELAGFDIGSGDMVFYQTFGGPEDGDLPLPEAGAGVKGNPIFIHDDVLYYLSRSISAWDLKTGERLYRHVFTRDVPVSKRYVQDSVQPVYYKGKIYYTSGAPDNPMGHRNIHCIDAETGKLVWNAIAKDSESLDTNPIIAHKRMYVSQDSGLRVYEPKTGKLIGVDKTFCGAGMGRNILYNDYMICVRKNPDTGDGRLVAVYVGK